MDAPEQALPAGWRARLRQLVHKLSPWLLSLIAILVAVKVEDLPVFQRISFVISDELSRKLGGETENVVLVRLDRSFPRTELERLLSNAIPTLMTDYRPAAMGVDIDFSGQGYSDLAANFERWSAKNPDLANKVVWAVGYGDDLHKTPQEPSAGGEAALCEGCSGSPGLSCKVRFTPKPVFGNSPNASTGTSSAQPLNYGLAIALPDLDGVNRHSARFVCHSQSEMPLKAFHFKLVELYCDGRSQLEACRDLQHNKQARTTIYSWYKVEPIDLCRLVNCAGDLGSKSAQAPSDLFDKIVLLYSDTPSNDEHMTMMGEHKGAEIVASLVENELQFGVAPSWHAAALKMTVEAILTLLLIFLFHWRRTESWAIVIAAALFGLYIYLTPWLGKWVPDFRNYVLAIILAFWIEVLFKSAWHSVASHQ